jgi:competence protein ComGE
MFRKFNGFTLLETLVALNIWLFLIVSLLPQLIHLEKERYNLTLMATANQVLQEELTHYLYDSASVTFRDVVKDNKYYAISWEEMDTNMIKICVAWKDDVDRDKEKCGYGKR